MRNTALLIATAIIVATTTSTAQRADTRAAESPEVVLKTAMNLELVGGDLVAAVARYRAIADRYRTAAPPVAAKALVQLAASYDRLGKPEARRAYEEILRVFPEQLDAASVARARLGAAAAQAGAGVTLRSLPRTDGEAGTVSPDGRYLSFSPWADGELYVRDLQTGTDRLLTRRGDFNIGLSAVSRDAAQVAYQAYGGGCEAKQGGLPALCVIPLAGSGIPVAKALFENPDILEVAPMDWSPDGRTIAVSLRRQDRTAQIGLVTVADGSLRVLRSVDWRGPLRVTFSPDGRDLVFDLPVSDTSEDRDIMMVAVDGSRGSTIVEHASQDILMGWTPDGSAILFASDRGGAMSLWLQPIRERRPQGAPRLIRGGLAGLQSAGVTRDGALYFAVDISERDIWVTAVDFAAGKEVAAQTRVIQQFVGTNAMPDWSADGRYLAYVSQRGGGPAGRVIGIRDVRTGAERMLRPPLVYFGPIEWAPDGASLVTAGTDLKGRTGVFTVDARTGEAALVVEGILNASPRWSPDGKRLFYRKGAQQQYADFSIVERDLGSGTERTIARGEVGVFSVSPDGRSIVAPVGGIANASSQAIVEFRVANGEMRELLRVGSSERLPPYVAPQWTPDGRAVLARKRSPNELWLLPTTGAPPRKLDVDVREWSFGSVGQISVHPDGRQVAFLSGNRSTEVQVLENFLPQARASR